MSKVSPGKKPVALPTDTHSEPQQLPTDPEALFHELAARILNDPYASPTDQLRAAEVFLRVRPTPAPTIEQLTRAETAGMSDAQLDELVGYLAHPLNVRDPREVERDIAAKTAKLEAEFDARVDAKVRELVDVEAVEARVEQRARQIAEQGRPLAPAPTLHPSEPKECDTHEVVEWPPDRRPRRPA